MQTLFIDDPDTTLGDGEVAIAIAYVSILVGLIAAFFHSTTWTTTGIDGTISATTEGWKTWAGAVAVCTASALILLVLAFWWDDEFRLRTIASLAGAALACLIGAIVTGVHWHALRSGNHEGDLSLAMGLPVAFFASCVGFTATLAWLRNAAARLWAPDFR